MSNHHLTEDAASEVPPHPELANLTAPLPQGHYLPVTRCGQLLATAGMTPRVRGDLQFAGTVGAEVSLDTAREAAQIAVRNALMALTLEDHELADTQLLRMTVYVAAEATFRDHSRVADAASEILKNVLGERGVCARSAIGVSSLPSGACVEIELTAVLEE